MKVLKFGGTSVGSAERMQHVARLVSGGEPKIVVLSAMSGTTNTLLQLSGCLAAGNTAGATDLLNGLQRKYERETAALFAGSTGSRCREAAEATLQGYFGSLREQCLSPYTPATEKMVVAFGELISTALFTAYLQDTGEDAVLLPALDYMRLAADGEPDMQESARLLKQQLAQQGAHHLTVTQGFICRNAAGDIDNLKRGGSDYSASIVGAITGAEEIQIWTDIDGMHNNDPRYVEQTQPVPQLSFEEAAELAYFGAKILHPTCILPAKMHNIPVRLLNTMDPSAAGTLISGDYKKGKIEAIAAKDGITVVCIRSDRMLLAYGFLARVFSIFEKHRTPIDLITTSEVAVSMSVDSLEHIGDIVGELRALGTVSIETGMSIISVVGDLQANNLGFEAKVIDALREIPVRMISYGASEHNISLLVRTEDKVRALNSLSDNIFNKTDNGSFA